jgi:hypothetical protein
MKKIIYLFVFTLISFTAMSKGIDFSGTWNLNKPKCTLNDQFSMAPSQLILSQTSEILDVEKHANFQGQDITINDKFTLDGKECINKGWQDSKKTSVISWSADEKLLTITSKIPMQDGTDMTMTETYQMEGANLKVVANANSSFGEWAETYLFDKQ